MSFPVGTVVGMIGVNPDKPPDGWLYCNGDPYNGVEYPLLVDVCPDNTLPNLVGLTLIGAGTNKNGKYPASSLGSANMKGQNPDGTYGSALHVLQMDEMPAHQHFGFGEGYENFPLGQIGNKQYQGSHGGQDSDNYYYGTTFAGGDSPDPTIAGNNVGFDLFQPSFAIYFFIYAGSTNISALKTLGGAHVQA